MNSAVVEKTYAPLASEIDSIAAALEQALKRSDLSHFYQAFRATSLPFLCEKHKADIRQLFLECFEVVHRLGGISPAVALAVENHYYVTAAIATFPAEAGTALKRRQDSMLQTIVDRRWLVANTNSKIHGNKLGLQGTVACREGSGYRINGTASYTSLATECDLLILMTELTGEGSAIFAISPVQGNAGVELGGYLFPNAMIDSDTRQIRFRDLLLPSESLMVTGGTEVGRELFSFEMAWHQLLIPALYLGSAARAIIEARAFLSSTRGWDGSPLATADGMIVDIGRLAIEYQSARCIVENAADALNDVRELPRDAQQAKRALYLASAAKYAGTRAAEYIVTAAR